MRIRCHDILVEGVDKLDTFGDKLVVFHWNGLRNLYCNCSCDCILILINFFLIASLSDWCLWFLNYRIRHQIYFFSYLSAKSLGHHIWSVRRFNLFGLVITTVSEAYFIFELLKKRLIFLSCFIVPFILFFLFL